ncbi:hypothetical protein Cflav_PD5534 [Pedosphaera parvula Ellin514]|uniref:Uncharacterized protein n=1 Tax=Pedosphaera parvula (strain Ellin514) TaxID=320771 RepID=B9XBL4_PEDPL|nr:hypothetical protein Cflav_PD5534 [Pedosphaera parvula Ellin514]
MRVMHFNLESRMVMRFSVMTARLIAQWAIKKIGDRELTAVNGRSLILSNDE